MALRGVKGQGPFPSETPSADEKTSTRLSRIRKDSLKQLTNPQQGNPCPPDPKQRKRNAAELVCVPFVCIRQSGFRALPQSSLCSDSSLQEGAFLDRIYLLCK